jgi:hypothetical protein
MFNIGDWMYDLLGPDSAAIVILFIFLIFLIDAIAFPTLPELFFIIGFMYDPSLSFGFILLFAVVIAEVIGITLLYYVVEHVRVPERIKRIADRYVKFLVFSDERMLLVNRVAPMVPFAGAFISLIDGWKLSRSLLYVVIGCLLKYGIIMMMSSFFFEYFTEGDAQLYTIILIIAVIAISMAAAFLKRKKGGLANENC